MSGARSSHWPWNAFAPPMPAGPTMSGPLPEAISVASASFAPAYGTASNVRWMSGWDALNCSTTFFSTSTCSGASPPPRQQYHRTSVWPGFGVEPLIGIGVFAGALALASASPPDAGAEAAGADAAVEGAAADGAVVGLVALHAPAASATTAVTAMSRIARMCSSSGLGWLAASAAA